MICIICEKEFVKNVHNQLCCSKECKKLHRKQYIQEYNMSLNGKKVINQYQKDYRNKHNEELKEYNKKYSKEHKEELKLNRKEYDKTYRKKYNNSLRGKEVRKRRKHKRRRNLGFNPLNNWFEESHAHHIDKINVIYISIKLHKSIYHNLFKNININEINIKTWDFLESNSY